MRTSAASPLIPMVFALGACIVEDPVDSPRICRAQLTPRTFHYTIRGDVLSMQESDQTAKRVAPGEDLSMPIYGTWNLLANRYPGQGFMLNMRFEPDRVTSVAECDYGELSVMAEASSRAVITDTTVQILEAAEDSEMVPDTD